MAEQTTPKICYCRVHGTMMSQGSKQVLSAPSSARRDHVRTSPPAIPPHRNVFYGDFVGHVHVQINQFHQYQGFHPGLQYPEQLNNFYLSSSTVETRDTSRHRRRHRHSPNTRVLDQSSIEPKLHCHHQEKSHKSRPKHHTRSGHRPEYKSAPSSPVAHYRTRIDSSSSQMSKADQEVQNTKVHNLKSRKPKKSASYFDEESPAHVPILPQNRSSTKSSQAVSKGHVTTGCCVSIGMNRLNKNRRPISGSYSALDTLSNASEDLPDVDELKKNHVPVSDCVKNIVSWMGKGTTALIDALPSLKEDHHIVMVGLDSAGKTTVLYRLKFDQYVNTVPTIGFNCERVRGFVGRSRNLTFLVWDVGGQEKIRPLWKAYTRATDGIIFVVDSCESSDRMEEARLELHRIMRTPDNKGVPLLIIANKQDLPSARTTSEIEKFLGLQEFGHEQFWHLESACAVTGEGLDVGLESLLQLIIKRKKLGKRARNKTR